MSIPDTLTPRLMALLREAANWRLLGLLFEYPSPQWRARLSVLLPDLAPGSWRDIAAAALDLNSEGLHLALFGPGGTVPVREAAYQGGVQLGYLLSELSAYYEAFGYKPGIAEADDHLAVELGFVAYLKMKEAFALASGAGESASVSGEAAAAFVRGHIAVSAPSLARRLETFAPGYLAEAGRILLELAGTPPPNAYPLGDSFDLDESGDLTCGEPSGGPGLFQIQS
jgi:nitrate reductase assembly molybdenum cofactor insertion protein NarJ